MGALTKNESSIRGPPSELITDLLRTETQAINNLNNPSKKYTKNEVEANRASWRKGMTADSYHVTPENLDSLKQLAADPNNTEIFLADINRTVKNDNHVILSVFYSGLSAYIEALNLALKAESGAGKTYAATSTINYFPEQDVFLIGSQSPKVISHEHGQLMTGNDELLDLEDAPIRPKKSDFEPEDFKDEMTLYKAQKQAWDDKIKNSYYLVKLDGKILVFLDKVSFETFEMFKTTLSHDAGRIPHRYVDDRGQNHTTILEGHPTAIFLSVDSSYIEEFATRTFTATPTTTKAKIEAAKQVINKKRSFPWEFDDKNIKQNIKALIMNIRDLVKEQKLKIVNPFPNLEQLFDSNVTRDMRDFDHFTQLLQAYTLFKIYQRPTITIENQRYIITSLTDVLEAKQLFDEIEQTTKTGTDKKILDFYEKYVKNEIKGTKLEAFIEAYNKGEERNNNPISDSTIRNWLNRLNRLGWVQIKKGEDATDKRKATYYPLKFSESSLNSESGIDLKLKLEKDFDSWLQTISFKGVSTIEFFRIGESFISQPIEQLKKLIIGGESYPSLTLVSKPEEEPKAENTPETISEPEIKLDSLNTSNSETRVCGDCGRHLLDSCQHPLMTTGEFDPKLVKDNCSWACECKGFLVKQPEMPNFDDKEP